ncbi:MAG: Phenylacetic acid catabolic protein [Candidatus Kryptoniota bacterium]
MQTIGDPTIINPSHISNTDRRRLTEERIRTNTAIEDPNEMSDDYYETLIRLLLKTAESELSLAFARHQWLFKASLIEQKFILSDILRGHLRVANTIFKLTKSIGFDASSYTSRYHFYPDPGFGNSQFENPPESGIEDRILLPYQPVSTWLELSMSLFCITRAVSIKMENTISSSFGPWKRECRVFVYERKKDLIIAESWIKNFVFNKSMKKETELMLEKWFTAAVNEFVREDEGFAENQKRLGLGKKSIQELKRDFQNEMRTKCSELGLHIPE